MSRMESLKIKAKLLQKSKKKSGKSIQLKEAYEIIARSAGYADWRSMKKDVEKYKIFRPSKANLPYWNNWYSTYEEAKTHLSKASEYLLPFEGKFFLCGSDYIEALGIAPDDQDLKLVGNDWAFPKDEEALTRIVSKIKSEHFDSK